MRRRIRSFYKHNTSVFYTLLGLIVVMFFTIGLGISSYFADSDVVESEDKFWLSGEISGKRLLRVFIEKSFGELDPTELHSVRFNGTIFHNGTKNEIYLLKKRPKNAILKINLRSDIDLTYGVNNEMVWGRLQVLGDDDRVYKVSGEEAERIAATATFFSPFVEFAADEASEAESVELTDELGAPSVKVTFKNPLRDCMSVAYLDGENLNLIRRVDFLNDEDEYVVAYSDYRSIEGLLFPFTTKTFSGGELSQEIVLEGVTVNPGVVTSLFAAPAGLINPNE